MKGCDAPLEEQKPTDLFNFEQITHNNVLFQVWDLGGGKEIRKKWNLYFVNADNIIFVVDSSDHHRLGLLLY